MSRTAPYTAFGETRDVPIKVYHRGVLFPLLKVWDETLWIERGEDWYALEGMKGRVRVIERDVFIKSKMVNDDR